MYIVTIEKDGVAVKFENVSDYVGKCINILLNSDADDGEDDLDEEGDME